MKRLLLIASVLAATLTENSRLAFSSPITDWPLVAHGVSAELHRDYSEVWSTTAAECFDAPSSNGGFSGRISQGFELKNHPGQLVRNQPGTINGRQFSGHALDQLQNRGIPPSVVENAIKHGQPFAGKFPDTKGFFDPVNRIRVIINSQTGDVVTVIPGGP